MTSEEQVKSKSAWMKLRGLAKNWEESDDANVTFAHEAASQALVTLRPLLAVAYNQGIHDSGAHRECTDPDCKSDIEDQSLQAIIDSLGLGLEA
jgi:hypothetical protein